MAPPHNDNKAATYSGLAAKRIKSAARLASPPSSPTGTKAQPGSSPRAGGGGLRSAGPEPFEPSTSARVVYVTGPIDLEGLVRLVNGGRSGGSGSGSGSGGSGGSSSSSPNGCGPSGGVAHPSSSASGSSSLRSILHADGVQDGSGPGASGPVVFDLCGRTLCGGDVWGGQLKLIGRGGEGFTLRNGHLRLDRQQSLVIGSGGGGGGGGGSSAANKGGGVVITLQRLRITGGKTCVWVGEETSVRLVGCEMSGSRHYCLAGAGRNTVVAATNCLIHSNRGEGGATACAHFSNGATVALERCNIYGCRRSGCGLSVCNDGTLAVARSCFIGDAGGDGVVVRGGATACLLECDVANVGCCAAAARSGSSCACLRVTHDASRLFTHHCSLISHPRVAVEAGGAYEDVVASPDQLLFLLRRASKLLCPQELCFTPPEDYRPVLKAWLQQSAAVVAAAGAAEAPTAATVSPRQSWQPPLGDSSFAQPAVLYDASHKPSSAASPRIVEQDGQWHEDCCELEEARAKLSTLYTHNRASFLWYHGCL